LPILIGPSRKSFLTQSTETALQCVSSAAVTAAILAGAHMIRVHDVVEMKAVAQVADQIVNFKFAGTSDSSVSRGLQPRSGGSASRK